MHGWLIKGREPLIRWKMGMFDIFAILKRGSQGMYSISWNWKQVLLLQCKYAFGDGFIYLIRYVRSLQECFCRMPAYLACVWVHYGAPETIGMQTIFMKLHRQKMFETLEILPQWGAPPPTVSFVAVKWWLWQVSMLAVNISALASPDTGLKPSNVGTPHLQYNSSDHAIFTIMT